MSSPRIADFYKQHHARSLAKFTIVHLGIALTVTCSAWLVYMAFGVNAEVLFLASGALFLMLEIAATFFFMQSFGEPLRILSDAIGHVSNQERDVTPPDVNKKSYESSGLKQLVQTVYELSVASFQSTSGPETENNLNIPLERIPSCIVSLNDQGDVIYCNHPELLTTDKSGAKQLEFTYGQRQTLDEWLASCRETTVKADTAWKHLADKLPGKEDRHIYDVYAHYEKGGNGPVETVLLLVDKTEEYARGEEEIDFIALAAHELRGPITVIRGYLQVLNDELSAATDSEQKQLFDRVKVSADRLSGYVNNILNAAKFDRAHLKLRLQEESLPSIVSGLKNDLELRATTQGRHLVIELPDDLPGIAADRSSLSEVITNLVDNGIKYSRDGGEVRVDAKANGDIVELTVTDNGIGIPSSVVGSLFTKFYRSHRSKQAVSGTGLGLYISKAIVESHGGKLWVRSIEDKGSMFGVELPTYASVADKLANGDNANKAIIEGSHGWIKNHTLYRG